MRKSIPVAEAIQARLTIWITIYDLGPSDLNISGCMNACHITVGNIGVLGVDKKVKSGTRYHWVETVGSTPALAGFSGHHLPGPDARRDSEYPDHLSLNSANRKNCS